MGRGAHAPCPMCLTLSGEVVAVPVAPRRITWMWLVSALCLASGALAPVVAEDRDEWQQPERVIADLQLRPGLTVADVGCGYGYFTFRMASAVGGDGQVYAADISDEALGSVREQARDGGLTNVEVVRSDPTDAKLPASSVDAVLFCDVLHEMPAGDRLPLLRNAVGSLRPGGFLHLIDYRQSRDITFDPYEKLIPHDDLVALGTDAGCTLDAEFHYLKYQVFLRFRKPATE